jgi:hypothetical protein
MLCSQKAEMGTIQSQEIPNHPFASNFFKVLINNIIPSMHMFSKWPFPVFRLRIGHLPIG